MDLDFREQGFRLILASASPRRRELLRQAGFEFEVDAADVDETQRVGEDAEDYVRRLAEEKASAVFARRGAEDSDSRPLVVLGADTSVVCDGEVLGKPADARDAERMLRRLSGRAHRVLTGVAVATRAGVVNDVVTTEVTFLEIAEGEIEAYCATGEPLDKAGAYGIQGYAARWVPRIDGCYFNVMGLPIARVVGLIEEAVGGL